MLKSTVAQNFVFNLENEVDKILKNLYNLYVNKKSSNEFHLNKMLSGVLIALTLPLSHLKKGKVKTKAGLTVLVFLNSEKIQMAQPRS